MTTEGGENTKPINERLDGAKKFPKNSLEIINKKDSERQSDEQRLKELRENFLSAYSNKNNPPESWGQELPPAAQAVPTIELDPIEINSQLTKLFKKRELAALQKTTNKGEENINPSKNNLNKLAKFREAIEKYIDSTPTPESETEYWQARWEFESAKVGLKIKVTDCDRTMEELKELESKGRKLIYVPRELSTPYGLAFLDKMYPRMLLDKLVTTYKEKGKKIMNENDVSGWIDVEESPNAPRKGTTEDELQEQYKYEGLIGMNLQVFIIASQDSKDLNKKYFDEQTLSRLLGTSIDGLAPAINSNSDGLLHLDTPDPKASDKGLLGGRSVGVKKIEQAPPIKA